jgi:hypothetical protein
MARLMTGTFFKTSRSCRPPALIALELLDVRKNVPDEE